jgi:hypothetical protein
MNLKNSISKLFLASGVLVTSVGAIACGGGGGGSGSDATIQGSLASDSPTSKTLGAGEGGMAGVQVSALGSTDTTDEFGNFELSADGEAFSGGKVEFSFAGSGLNETVALDGVQGGPGAITVATFTVSSNGNISGEATDLAGNVLGTTPGGALKCVPIGTFVDGGQGRLWKPVSESHGTPVTLMPARYGAASVGIYNNRGELVDTPLRRNCCDHNGGRDHAYFSRTATDLATTGVPLTVRYEFPDGSAECLTVDNPSLRYD